MIQVHLTLAAVEVEGHLGRVMFIQRGKRHGLINYYSHISEHEILLQRRVLGRGNARVQPELGLGWGIGLEEARKQVFEPLRVHVGDGVELAGVVAALFLVPRVHLVGEVGRNDELLAVVGHVEHGDMSEVELVQTLHNKAVNIGGSPVTGDAALNAALGHLAEVSDHGAHEVGAGRPRAHGHVDQEAQVASRGLDVSLFVGYLETQAELKGLETLAVCLLAELGRCEEEWPLCNHMILG